jgi:hypothetical protein
MSIDVTVSQVFSMLDRAERDLEQALAAISNASDEPILIDHVEAEHFFVKGKHGYNVKIIGFLRTGKG